HHFERNDLDLADQLLAHVEPADEMRRHADIVQVLEDVFGYPVVKDPLAFDHLVLFGIEGGRVVLEVLDQCSGLGPFVEDLRLAFVNAATAAHRSVPGFCEIHCGAVAPFRMTRSAAAIAGATQLSGPSATAKLAEREAEHNRHRPAPR